MWQISWAFESFTTERTEDTEFFSSIFLRELRNVYLAFFQAGTQSACGLSGEK